MYSKVFNGLFLFSNGFLDENLFINFFKEFGSNICLNDLKINETGEIGILECNGELTIFNQNGKKKYTYLNQLNDTQHIISFNSDWFIFNSSGGAVNSDNEAKYFMDLGYNKILDIKIINRSIAVLTNDHILFMDVN
jgi:hypothetical protein